MKAHGKLSASPIKRVHSCLVFYSGREDDSPCTQSGSFHQLTFDTTGGGVVATFPVPALRPVGFCPWPWKFFGQVSGVSWPWKRWLLKLGHFLVSDKALITPSEGLKAYQWLSLSVVKFTIASLGMEIVFHV